ncbi:MAG: GNAT family N-acetyltransferase [Ruminococcus sp.]|nr:GNAT family N-acetyltransferase [Ruminococcus sp.]
MYGVIGVEIKVEYCIENCNDIDDDYICNKLVEYNLSQVPKTQNIDFENINKKFVDSYGNIIAGCIARMYCWHVLYVDILWVDEKYRKKGLGSKLLKYVEDNAAKKGCYLVHLDTFDFQAKDFYIKHGYEIFGILNDCPMNHSRIYLQKRL